LQRSAVGKKRSPKAKKSPQPELTTLPLQLPSTTAFSFMEVTPAPHKDLTTAGGSRFLTTPGHVASEIKLPLTTKTQLSRLPHREPTLVPATTKEKSGFTVVTAVLTTPVSLSATSTLLILRLKHGQSTSPLSPRLPFLRVVVDIQFSHTTTSFTRMVAGTLKLSTTTSSSST